jgi:hypothetical protein
MRYGIYLLSYGGEAVALNYVGLYFKTKTCSHGGRPPLIEAMGLGAGRRLVTTLRFSHFGVGRQSVFLLSAPLSAKISGAKRQ